MDDNVMETLLEGGFIHYAPVGGGMILLIAKGERAAVQPSMIDFVNAKADGTLVMDGEMGQGHHVFHGRVLFYKPAPRKR